MRAMVTTYTQAKGQGQRSLGSKVRIKTDGQTDALTEEIALPPVLTLSVMTFCYFSYFRNYVPSYFVLHRFFSPDRKGLRPRGHFWRRARTSPVGTRSRRGDGGRSGTICAPANEQ